MPLIHSSEGHTTLPFTIFAPLGRLPLPLQGENTPGTRDRTENEGQEISVELGLPGLGTRPSSQLMLLPHKWAMLQGLAVLIIASRAGPSCLHLVYAFSHSVLLVPQQKKRAQGLPLQVADFRRLSGSFPVHAGTPNRAACLDNESCAEFSWLQLMVHRVF